MFSQKINVNKRVYIPILILRFAMGGLMLQSGLTKLLSGKFSAAGYLQNGIGPFADLFSNLTPNIALLNNIVIWSEIAIGIALVFGLFVRLASYGGSLMMILYYLPYLPPTSGWINQQIIYLIVFIVLIFSGVGYFLGLDTLFIGLENNKKRTRWIFG